METSQRPWGAEQDAVARLNRSRSSSCRPVLCPQRPAGSAGLRWQSAFGCLLLTLWVLADGFRRPVYHLDVVIVLVALTRVVGVRLKKLTSKAQQNRGEDPG